MTTLNTPAAAAPAKALLGTKLGMTQIWDENGVLRPVTVVRVDTNVVTQVRTIETDGYEAVQLAFGDFFGVFDGVEEEAVFATGRGINGALPAIDEVVRGERAAVAPFGVAQVEGVGFAVCGDFPFFSDAGDEVAARVFADEAFKEVAQDVRFRHALCGLRVECLRFATVAATQYAFGIRGLYGNAECGGKQDY